MARNMEGEPRDPAPDSGGLPPELQTSARNLEKALKENQNVGPAFADFCAKAYVRPEWAGPASEFIVEQFEGREPELAALARIPDLIIELASGQQTLTTTVAFQWASAADSARLAKLAEALAATQSKIQSAEVVDLMLALATSLAITRYSKAEQMLNLAEPQALGEHQDSLAEARLWLAVGRILRGCSQETRDLFDHRLRRRRTPWKWETPVECGALQELADHLHPEQEGANLFRSIVPPAWWDVAARRASELAEMEARQEAQPEPSLTAPSPMPVLEVPQTPLIPPDQPQVIVWNTWPFFTGGLVGAAALALVIWISPYELRKASLDSEIAASSPAGPVVEAPSPQEIWRKEEAARLAEANADLKDLHSRILSAKWEEISALLAGDTADLPKSDARYARLLKWLHLDPPADEAIRQELPRLLAAQEPNSDTLDLWEKLAYTGSPMAKAIQKAAARQIYENRDAWSPTQERQLNRLGWPPAP